jgi:hypothetical protein
MQNGGGSLIFMQRKKVEGGGHVKEKNIANFSNDIFNEQEYLKKAGQLLFY